MGKRYYIICDESTKKGKYYSHFYGGVLLEASNYNYINNKLNSVIPNEKMNTEFKWEKINKYQIENYIKLINKTFDLVAEGFLRIRIKFTKNEFIPNELTKEQKSKSYFLLYYQFIKHSFGLMQLPQDLEATFEVFFDKIPDTKHKKSEFIKYIKRIPNISETIDHNFNFEQVSEYDSRKIRIAQALDVILGSMQFKLNKKDKFRITKGKIPTRTKAKINVYKHINKRIRDIYPNFNIGVSTGKKGNMDNLWFHPYRHWSFKPKTKKSPPSSYKPPT